MPLISSACFHTAPAGYKLKDGTHVHIELCAPGTVSFYTGDPLTSDRVPANDELNCIACSDLDDALSTTKWAHTFAPRKGMTQCIPCPGGTIPKDANDATSACAACPNGSYRDANTISASCTACGPGNEVGPNNKMACTQW
jgi:hypothetical protein